MRCVCRRLSGVARAVYEIDSPTDEDAKKRAEKISGSSSCCGGGRAPVGSLGLCAKSQTDWSRRPIVSWMDEAQWFARANLCVKQEVPWRSCGTSRATAAGAIPDRRLLVRMDRPQALSPDRGQVLHPIPQRHRGPWRRPVARVARDRSRPSAGRPVCWQSATSWGGHIGLPERIERNQRRSGLSIEPQPGGGALSQRRAVEPFRPRAWKRRAAGARTPNFAAALSRAKAIGATLVFCHWWQTERLGWSAATLVS